MDKKKLSPEQMRLYDIGDPGLRLVQEKQGFILIVHSIPYSWELALVKKVHSAEIVGVAGIEKTFDSQLRDPAHSKKPFKLTIDLSIQAAIEHVLEGGMRL